MRNPIEQRFRRFILHRYGDTVTDALTTAIARVIHDTNGHDDQHHHDDREEGGHPITGLEPPAGTTPRPSGFLSPVAWGDS